MNKCFEVFVSCNNPIGGFFHYFKSEDSLKQWYQDIKNFEEETKEKVYHQEPKELTQEQYNIEYEYSKNSKYTFFH